MSWKLPKRMSKALRARVARVPQNAAQSLAPVITGYLREQFASSHDPYGNPWQPLAASTIARKGDDWILVRSGKTAGTIEARNFGSGTNAGIRIRTMGWHQYPTRYRPARPILPIGPIPPRWAEAAREALDQAMLRALRPR